MTEAVISVAAILILAVAILAALYFIVRHARPQPQGQSYRRHRPWNFKWEAAALSGVTTIGTNRKHAA
jgi:hypothetical protein